MRKISIKKEDNNKSVIHLKLDKSTFRKCPICNKKLLSSIFYNTEIDYCERCLGLWFDEKELCWAKNQKDENLKWFDIDLWKDKEKFKVSYGVRICPCCRVPLYEVYYGDSGIIVDICRLCRGIWLDRVEFKKIIGWLQVKADYEIMNNYAKNLFKQAQEVFNGPETLREEIEDFLIVFNMLNYRFSTIHPVVSRILLNLPK